MNDSDITMMKEAAKKDYLKSSWWKRATGKIRMIHILTTSGHTYSQSEKLTAEYVEHMKEKAKDQRKKRTELMSEINPVIT